MRRSTACGLPPSPSIRCTKVWHDWSAWRLWAGNHAGRTDRSARAELGRVRFLLRPLQVHRQHGRRRQFRREGEADRTIRCRLPRVTALKPDVLIVTGDHSTPAYLKSHSWHPVPTLLVSDCCRPDPCQEFSERQCVTRRAGPVRSQVLDVAGTGQRRSAGKIRCLMRPQEAYAFVGPGKGPTTWR